jgi:hypothetical protein
VWISLGSGQTDAGLPKLKRAAFYQPGCSRGNPRAAITRRRVLRALVAHDLLAAPCSRVLHACIAPFYIADFDAPLKNLFFLRR